MSPEAPETENLNESGGDSDVTKEASRWKEIFRDYLGHLSRTTGPYTPSGDPVTEDWLYREATAMADAKYKKEQEEANDPLFQAHKRHERESKRINEEYGFDLEKYEVLSDDSKKVFLDKMANLTGEEHVASIDDLDLENKEIKQYIAAAWACASLAEKGIYKVD